MTLSADERAAIEARHFTDNTADGVWFCDWEAVPWPCDTEKVRAALVAAEARAKALTEALEAHIEHEYSSPSSPSGKPYLTYTGSPDITNLLTALAAYREAGG